MISIEKLKISTPLQKLPKNVGNLGKLIVAKGFEKLPKVQKIAQSGYTAVIQLNNHRDSLIYRVIIETALLLTFAKYVRA